MKPALDRFASFLGALCLAWLLLMSAGVVPAVCFARERIEVSILPRRLGVTGYYYFENPLPFPMTQGMSYPFPVDSAHPRPSDAQIILRDPETKAVLREIPSLWIGGQPRYSLRVPARGKALVRVSYEQDAADNSVAYILTTTKSWRRSLARGEYVLLPHGVAITQSSYPLDGGDHLSFMREGFMPPHDWRFSWRPL